MSGAAVAASVGTSVLNTVGNLYTNAQNLAEQRRWNNAQIGLAKNAYSIAAADKMKAGLSPLDTNAAETPSLQAGQVSNPIDTSGIQHAVDVAMQSRVNDSVIRANNAKASSDMADAEGKDIDNQLRLQNAETELETAKSQLQNLQDKHSEFAQTLEKKIQRYEQEIENLRLENEKMRSNIRDQDYNYEFWKSLNMPTDTGLSLNPGTPFALGSILGSDFYKLSQNSKDAHDKGTPEELSQSAYRKYQADVSERSKELERQYRRGDISKEEYEEEKRVIQELRDTKYPEWRDKMQRALFGAD